MVSWSPWACNRSTLRINPSQASQAAMPSIMKVPGFHLIFLAVPGVCLYPSGFLIYLCLAPVMNISSSTDTIKNYSRSMLDQLLICFQTHHIHFNIILLIIHTSIAWNTNLEYQHVQYSFKKDQSCRHSRCGFQLPLGWTKKIVLI